PLVHSEAPCIGTVTEERAARDAGDVILAEGAGEDTEITGDHITVQYNRQDLGRKIYRLAKFRRSNQGTCINQKPIVEEGQKISPGEVLADGPSTHHGHLALGK